MPRLGAVGWLRWAWRQLTSMRTALLLLMLLAVAAIPGSVFPQNRIDPSRVNAYRIDHPTAARWLQRLGGFDVYTSPWFSAIYLLLFISLVGCVLPRSRQHFRALRAAPPKAPRRLERMPAHVRAATAADPDAVLAAARAELRRRHYRVLEREPGTLSAERGRLAETGNLAFHLALVVLLVAVATGSFLGYSGQAIVVTGRTFANTLPQYDGFAPGRAVDPKDLSPFSLTLDALHVRFETQVRGNQLGAPRDFRADLTYRRTPESAPERRTIRVNDPLDVDGARVFLVGNGYAPVVTVTDGEGQKAFSGPVPFIASDGNYTSNGVIKGPDARPSQLGFVGFLLPTAARNPAGQPVSIFPDLTNPVLILTGYSGDLGLGTGAPQSVYILETSKLTQLTSGGAPFSAALSPGQSAKLPGGKGSVRFDGVQRYAGFDVRYDPTKLWVLVSALTALAGLTCSLYVRRRRVWVRIRPDRPDAATDPADAPALTGRARDAVSDQGAPGSDPEGGGAAPGRTLVEVAGLARAEDARLEAEVAAILAAVVR
jgi:cytochrome c biogenesis protein